MHDPSRAARQGALLVEQPLSTLVLSGPDRREWLNGLLTCDVKALEAGQGAWGLALTKQGKILSDVNVVATGEAIYLGVPARAAPVLYETLSQFLIMEDAELLEPSDELAWITLHGPRAAELAARLAVLPQSLARSDHDRHERPAATRTSGEAGGLAGGAEATRGDAAGLGIADFGAWGAIDWTGLGGAAVVAPRARVSALLAAAVAPADEDVVIGTAADWDRLRVERAVPAYGTDYDDRDNPHDASLERRAVSWTKGCYLGQEVVCMQDMRGKLKRRVVTLALEAGAPSDAATVVDDEGKDVGEVTSRTFSELYGKSLVLARVSAKALETGRLFIAGRPAELVATPL